MKVNKAIGIVIIGSKNEMHRYFAYWLPFLQETNHKKEDESNRKANGITKKWSFMKPGPDLSGGYLFKFRKGSLGQVNDCVKLITIINK